MEWTEPTSTGSSGTTETSDTVARRSRWPLAFLAAAAAAIAITVAATRGDGRSSVDDVASAAVDEDGTTMAESRPPIDPAADFTVVDDAWAWRRVEVPERAIQVGLIDGRPWALTVDGPLQVGEAPTEFHLLDEDGDWQLISAFDGFGRLYVAEGAVLRSDGAGLSVTFGLGERWHEIQQPGEVGRYVHRMVSVSAALRRDDGNLLAHVVSADGFDAGSYLADHHPEIDPDEFDWAEGFGRQIHLRRATGDGSEPTVILIDDALLDAESLAMLDGGPPEWTSRVLEIDQDGTVVRDDELELMDGPVRLLDTDGAVVVESGASAWRRTASGWVEEARSFDGRRIGDVEIVAEGLVRVRWASTTDWAAWDDVVGSHGTIAPDAAVLVTRPDEAAFELEFADDDHVLTVRSFDDWALARVDGGIVGQWYQPPLERVDDSTWRIEDPSGSVFTFTDREWETAVRAATSEIDGPMVLASVDGTTWARTRLGPVQPWVETEVEGGTAMVVGHRLPQTVDELLDGWSTMVAWVADIPS